MIACHEPIGTMNNPWMYKLRKQGFPFPENYYVFDCETTGLDTNKDYITEIGLIVVTNRRPESDPVTVYLNWLRPGVIGANDFKSRVNYTRKKLREINKEYHYKEENLKTKGKDPGGIIEVLYKYFKEQQDNHGYFLTHNGINYDTLILQSHFARVLGKQFEFDPKYVIDTGLLEKARQTNIWIGDNEHLASFYARILDKYSRSKWSLTDHCIPKYRLHEMHNLDLSKAHNAGFDCTATHLLFEEFRQQSEE